MKLLRIKPFQETLGQSACAPANLKMLLTYWNLPGKEKTDLELGKMLGTDPELGTTNRAFLQALRKFGLAATAKECATYEDIELWLRKGVPVVLDWFTPGRRDYSEGEMPDGHYSIAVGLDEKNIYLQDPEVGKMRTISRKQFWRVWFDFEEDWITNKDDMVLRWMAAVYPKGKSPRTVKKVLIKKESPKKRR